MKPRLFIRWLGVPILITGLALTALQLKRSGQLKHDRNTTVLRIGHFQLESGAREAFDAVIAEYEKLHPGVRIEQNPIPLRMYPAWLRTQLAGGTPPDLLQLQPFNFEEILAQYFKPISSILRAPNPYNQSAPDLATTPWIDTFLDGLDRGASFNGALVEHYGVPNTLFTQRMFVNRELLRRITGSEVPPSDYRALQKIYAQVDAYARQHESGIVPLVGWRTNSPALLNALLQTQIQPLLARIDRDRNLSLIYNDYNILSYLRGDWSLASPELQSGFALMQETGRHMQPGFFQNEREDALFHFAQGKALFIVAGSNDAGSIRQQCTFPIDIVPLPLPAKDDPVYGANMRAPVSEGGVTSEVVLGLTRTSTQSALAIDFLQFLTSRKMNELFAQRAGWLPVVVGAKVPDALRVFSPRLDGFPTVFPQFVFGPDTSRVIIAGQFQLYAPGKSVADYVAGLQPEFERALRSDLARHLKDNDRGAARQDSVLAAQVWLEANDPEFSAKKRTQVSETQHTRETRAARNRHDASPPPRPSER